MSALSLPKQLRPSRNVVIYRPRRCGSTTVHAIVGDYLGGARVGTAEHWRGVYSRVVLGLRDQFKSSTWPSDSYYGHHGHYRNPWRQFDAVITQLQQRTQVIVNKDSYYLDSQQGIRQWRHLMMPIVVDLDCSCCGRTYQKRVAVFCDDQTLAETRESECNLCIETTAANHAQMLADYLNTLSPKSRKIEDRMSQPRSQRPLKRHRRTSKQWEPRHRQRISNSDRRSG